ncbi:hypothetical protein [Tateyamaria omphalii]|uniref:hypothetical protein n=1 Tax=Tateyamaria omphalii TaxID=299262 RepID=UPI0020C77CF4|nr:hypothetical protein [Tateyamaria omphalii]
MDRRSFLVPGNVAAGGAGFTPAIARAEVGDTTLTTVSDGNLTLLGRFVFDPMPKDQLQPILAAYDLSPTQLTP